MPSQERIEEYQAKKEQKHGKFDRVGNEVLRKSRRMPSQERVEECQAKKVQQNAKPRKSKSMASQEELEMTY